MPSAIGDLEDLLKYISRDAPLTAKRFAQKIVKRVEQLQIHPLSGSWLPEDESQIYRQLLQGNYRIVYRFSAADSTVYIVAVHHAARLLDPGKLE